MGISNAGKENGMIQFAAYSRELKEQLTQDVAASSYSTKTQYLNALSARTLALQRRVGSPSCIDELFLILDLMEALPIEDINRLAPTQNRNFSGMFLQLIQESLRHYPAQPFPFDDYAFERGDRGSRALPQKHRLN